MKRKLNVKLIAIILICLITAISLCGCKKKASKPSDSSSEPTSTVSDTETKVENSSEEESSLISSTDSNTESSQKDSASSEDKPNKAPEASAPVITPPKADPSEPAISTKPITAEMMIRGKWRGSVDMAPMLTEIGYELEGEQMVFCDVEFASGGVINEVIDRASLKTVYTNVVTKALSDEMAKNNITKEQLEEAIGMTYEEYLNEAVQMAMDYIPQTIVSAYKFEGDVLYVREQEDTDFKKQEYSFDGENKLTMVEDGMSITYTRIS